MAKQVARLIKLQNRRRRAAAHGDGRIRRGVALARFERALAVNDPDVVLRIHGHADGHSHEPMIRQRLRPKGIHFKHRGLHGGRLDSSFLLK